MGQPFQHDTENAAYSPGMILGFAIALTPLAAIFAWSIASDGSKASLVEVGGGLLIIGVIVLGFLAYH